MGGVSLQSESGESEGLKPVNGEYQIGSAEDLREFAELVNGGETDANTRAELTDDIDLNNQPWYPIGSDSRPYRGTFDGDGHTISGLYINSSSDNYQGLFGYVSGSGKVQNLSVSGSVSGNNYVGGVVGDNGGSVENCYNTGSVTSSVSPVGGVVGWNSGSVENCYNTGEVSGNRYVGGVVGWNSGSVKNCYNTGTVSGPDSGTSNYVGGVVGYNSGPVKNCYNTGSVSGPDSGSGNSVGGVVGYNDGASVTNCYNTGTVSSNSNTSDVGGVVGLNSGNVENCYNTGTVTGTDDYVGGVVGYNSSIGNVTGCYFLQQNGVPAQGIGSGETTGATAVDDLSDLCEKFKDDTTNIWRISGILGRPVLQENPEGGDGTKEHPYEIKTADELENFRDLVNGEGGQAANPNAHAKLMNNIDLNGNATNQWTPIGNSSNEYTGNFNGNGHKIENLYINTTDSGADNQGLFGCLDPGGTVQNLSVSGNVSGDMYVGGIAGQNNGTIENCAFSGSVTSGSYYVGGVVGENSGSNGVVENCHNAGKVSGSNTVGGVVGDNSGTVENCYNTRAVNGSGSYVGGVVGDNNGRVENCYNTGTVTGSNYVGGVVGQNNVSSIVENCYNTGEVTGSGDRSNVGGVVGLNSRSGNVTNCYNTGSVSGSGNNVGGVVGLKQQRHRRKLLQHRQGHR